MHFQPKESSIDLYVKKPLLIFCAFSYLRRLQNFAMYSFSWTSKMAFGQFLHLFIQRQAFFFKELIWSSMIFTTKLCFLYLILGKYTKKTSFFMCLLLILWDIPSNNWSFLFLGHVELTELYEMKVTLKMNST